MAKPVVVGALVISLLSACGGPSGAPQAESAPAVEVVDPGLGKSATGDVTICGGQDAGGVYGGTVKAVNAANKGLNVKYTQIGADTDQLRTQAVQRLEGKSAECDIFMTDVTWVSEFASQKWFLDLTKVVEGKKDSLIPSTADTALYGGRYWGAPFFTNAGLMFYRTDRVAKPSTWQQVYQEAAKAKESQLVYQGAQYEGLTVNFLELLYSAGGNVLDDDGKVVIDSKETRDVLNLMAEGLKTGAAPRSVLTFKEDETRVAFESGSAGYERNWPFVYKQLKASSEADKFGVAPLPAYGDKKTSSGVLGGFNFAVSAYSKNVAGAVAVIDFALSPEWQKQIAIDNSRAPVVAAAYDDPKVQQAMPFAQELREAVTNAKPRPKSPVYAQISQAINKNVYSVLSGAATADEAVRKMSEEIKAAQKTF